ncbi:MAG: T9SS type A sorting domain-containing protein [Saprospiraceae bacterium]
MRIIIIIIILFFQIQITIGQSWEQMGFGLNQNIRTMQVDSINNRLFVGGAFVLADSNIVGCMAQWDSTGWSNMQYGNMNSMFSNCGQLLNMTIHQNNLHVVAAFHQYNQVKLLGRWNGTSWDSLSAITGTCRGLYSYGDTLYVLGENLTTDSFSNQRILGWDGTQWFSVINESFASGWIITAHWYKGKFYIGGTFKTSSGIEAFAVVNGQTLQAVGSGFAGGWTAVGDLVIYQDDLYVGGDFSKAAGNPGNNIARWNGNQWFDVGNGTGGVNFPSVLDMDIHNGYLYVCGSFKTAGDIPAEKIARWNGQNWCGLGSNIQGTVTNIEFYQDTLIAGLLYGNIDGINYNYIAKWNRGDYVDTCTNLIDNTDEVWQDAEDDYSLTIYPNPTSDYLQITTQKPLNEVQLYNTLGQQVYQQQGLQQEQVQIDVSHLPKGMYIVRVRQGEVWGSEQVVIQ